MYGLENVNQVDNTFSFETTFLSFLQYVPWEEKKYVTLLPLRMLLSLMKEFCVSKIFAIILPKCLSDTKFANFTPTDDSLLQEPECDFILYTTYLN